MDPGVLFYCFTLIYLCSIKKKKKKKSRLKTVWQGQKQATAVFAAANRVIYTTFPRQSSASPVTTSSLFHNFLPILKCSSLLIIFFKRPPKNNLALSFFRFTCYRLPHEIIRCIKANLFCCFSHIKEENQLCIYLPIVDLFHGTTICN